MASAVDDAVGTVMERIRREGLEGDTLVFFLSDNGGPTSNGSDNRPLRGHKATTWEGGVRVPFLVQWKGRLPAGKVYDRPVAQIDILPTALAAAGAEVDPAWKLDGVNLLPFLQGQDRGEPHEALYWRFGNQTAVRMGNWKLVRGRVGRAPERARDVVVTEPQLFNVAIDVGETRNVAAEQPERVGQLRAAWERWDAELPPPRWRGPDPPRDP
jgi:arylsulfatase A-like enzyme